MPKNLTKQQFFYNKTSWKNSFAAGLSLDEKGQFVPWMTYPAIDFLQKNITKDHDIFEFGCGASTLFFSRVAKSVTSLETNATWLKIVEGFLKNQNSDNTRITLMADGLDNAGYETFAINAEKKFDVIIVDSLKRFYCAKNSVSALKSGGMLILDDSERANYQKIFDFFAELGWQKQDFEGIEPGRLRVKKTTIFSC